MSRKDFLLQAVKNKKSQEKFTILGKHLMMVNILMMEVQDQLGRALIICFKKFRINNIKLKIHRLISLTKISLSNLGFKNNPKNKNKVKNFPNQTK